MRGHNGQDEELEEFIAARTQDLHHDAYQLTAAQPRAEELVIAVLAGMQRERIDLAQAGSAARLRMAQACARDNTPSQDSDSTQLAAQFRPLARLSPRQRAVLLLQVVDNYDEREIARELQLSSRATVEALASIPYDELPGTSPHSSELRSLLEEFGDLGTSPSASTILADVRAVPPPPRRPWWTYVAAFLVVALTVGTLALTQHWHNDWLKTPEGLNHAHGTHFPAYTQGYKLVAIQDVEPGPAAEFNPGRAAAVSIACDDLTPGHAMSVSSDLTGGNYYRRSADCTGKETQTQPIAVAGTTLVSVPDSGRDSLPVAIYRPVPLSEYPVATKDFDVQRDITINSMRTVTSADGSTLHPQVKGTVLNLRGTAGHPNGTFRGILHLPKSADATHLNIVGLLSPTTTGRYRVQIDHHAPWTNCGRKSTVTYEQVQRNPGCSLVDRRVPQIVLQQIREPEADARTVPVEITVKDATGPWTLQVVADRYAVQQRVEHGPTSVQTN